MAQLKSTTHPEEDKARLKSEDGPQPFTNERNALIYMAGEKEICHFYIDLMMECVKYIRMLKKRQVDEARKLQSILKAKYGDHDQIHNYSGFYEYVMHAIVRLLTMTFGIRDRPPPPPMAGRPAGGTGQMAAMSAPQPNGAVRTANKKKKSKRTRRRKGRRIEGVHSRWLTCDL